MRGGGVLAGKHALITGGGRGIGAAIATALAAEGARITLLGQNRLRLAQHAHTLPESAEAHVVVASVVDGAAVAEAFADARARHGDPAILVNNAGVGVGVPFTKVDEAAWNAVIGVNLNGTFHCTREVVPAMLAAGYGRIVNVASTAGLAGGKYIAPYTAAKHGVIGLTRALAAELGPKGITVNAVCPGFTESEMLDRTLSGIEAATGRTREEAAAALLARNPLGRFVRADEVASAVVWLCRADSAAVNGQAIVIDGGEVQH
ncbi:MAG TPA: SDR family NAD(P)-dependent oxidoreductase [Candidatus Elarobacter sp.]|jgi:NAD(P)-dependent dehydrogenase (short-subunit alcohol dehydrogenase family)|nr:SDR family NAD(P)-dependent oxidoreductase [Candidatus Elarobacter sp.]